jgi:DNA-binding MarR family transcriptional regulator
VVSRGSGLATEFESADDSPGLMLWRATNRWQAAQRAALKPFDLTHVQFVLLASLAYLDTDGPVTQKQLADHAATDVMMTSQVLRALENAGLVRRAPHPSDRRARALAVTAEGRALADRAVVAVEAADQDFFSVAGPELPGFTAVLRRLTGG